MDQLFQITEKADPVTAFGCGVVKVDVGGDVAEQVVADGLRVVFQILGEMGGVQAAGGAGVVIIVGARHVPQVAATLAAAFAEIQRADDEG